MKKSKLLLVPYVKPDAEKQQMIDEYLSKGYEIKGFTIDRNFLYHVLLVKED